MYKLVVFIFVLLILTGCDSPTCNEETISRELSPDKRVDAIISKTSCGATTDYSYKVYIVPSGSNSLTNHVFLADHTKGLKTHWVAKQQLHIIYDEARIFEYTNFWQSKELDNFNYLIKISEIGLSKN